MIGCVMEVSIQEFYSLFKPCLVNVLPFILAASEKKIKVPIWPFSNKYTLS